MATNLLAQLRKDNPRYAHYDDDQFIDLISSQAGIPRSQLMQRIGGEEQSHTPPTSLPTSVIDKLRADNPRYRHYSDEQWVSLIAENTNSTFEDAASMLGYQPPEPETISETQEERPSGFTGLLGNVVRGAKQAGRSIGAMGNTITGDLATVEDYARRSQESAEKEMPEEQRQLHSELQAIDREQGAMGQIGDTLGAAARNPMGTAQLITEQIPNSAVSLGSGWAGFKTGAALGAAAGPVGASIGGALGFLGGMFLGNYMLEGGSKAIEKAEGGFTEDERRETLTEGAKKAGVITAVDAATFKAGSMIANRLGGAAAVKNGAKAEAEVLMKAGVDMSSPATINAALAKSPELMKQAKIAGERAAINTLSRSKKAGIAGTGLSLETVGEGAGEYLGEMAATGEGDVVDATIEALAGFSQSAVQTVYNYNRLGNKLDPENIHKQAEEINQAIMQEGINNIANADTVDEAIQAAADTASQKPVTPGDVMDDIAYREELLKRTEAFTQGGANEETQQETITQPVQAAEVLGAQPKTARDTEIVLPDNTNLPAQWDVVDASQVQATMKEGENQPRDRTRTASESQIASIANDPNYALVSDSPILDVGAPTLDSNGAIVAGNGRFEGLSRAYQLGTATLYKETLMTDAARKGIDPAVIAGMERPILVRRITQPIDTRKTAIKSNSGLGLQYSALELAKIDAERMKNLSDIEVSDNGDIVLNAQNIQKLRNVLSDYDASELGALVDKDGMLSQEGVRRVKSAILHSAYGDSPTLGRMIESTDNDIRNITGALTKVAGNVARVRNDIKQGAIPEELDITNDLIEAVEKLAELKARSQPVDNYLAQQGLFGENITPESREFIQFLSNNMRSQKKLTEFINSVYDSIGSIDTTTADIFGDTPIPSKQDVIQHAKQRKDPGQPDGATDSGTAQQSQTRSENQRDPQERSGQSQKDERLIPVSKRGKKSADDLEYDSETIKRDLREISELNNIRFNENGIPEEKLISKIRSEKLRSFYSSKDGAKRLQQMVLFAGYKDPDIYDLPYSDNPEHRKIASTLASTGFLAEEMANEGEASIVPDIIDAIKSLSGKEQKELSELSKGIKNFIDNNDHRSTTQFLNGLFYAANSVTDTDSLPDTKTLLNEAADYANNKRDERLIPVSKRNKNVGVNENNVDYNDRQSNSSDKINEGVEDASTNQRKSSYNPNNLSLDLGTRNLDLDYGEIEQRPGTTEKQRELGRNAYRELLERAAHRGQGSLLGAAIAKDFKEHSGSTLVGRTVQSPEDLAVLAQVLRDPRFETFRIFFTKGDLIVHHTGVTSRMPASSRVHTQLPGETAKQAQERYVASVKQQMRDSGADGYYLLHNHPTGKAEPSVADIKLTEFLNKSVPGFKNHVIIDHNEYGVISMGDNSTTTISEVVQKELTGGYSNNNPSVPHNALRKNVIGPESLAEIGKMIERKDGYFTLIGLGAQLNVVSIAEFPADILNKPDIYLLGALRRFARHSGADSVAAVADNLDDIGKLHDAVFNRVLIDVIDAKTGKGSKGAGGRKLFDIGNSKNRAIQVKQDNSILRSTPAWHGSPHDHDQFSMDKIGSGEGAQAYGHGLYFAGNREVAEWYKNKLSGDRNLSSLTDKMDRLKVNGQRLLDSYDIESDDLFADQIADGDIGLAVDHAEGRIERWAFLAKDESYPFKDYAKDKELAWRSLVPEIKNGNVTYSGRGKLYQVELAPEQDEYLLWDKPLSEQSEKVKKIINSGLEDKLLPLRGKKNNETVLDYNEGMTGEELYKTLSGRHGGYGSDKKASEYLHSIGIRGIKYLDGSSRSKGDGAYNYVIFDDKDVSIVNKYSKRKRQAKSLSVDEVKQAVNPLRSRLGNGIKINVVQSTSDIPARVHERSVEDSVPIDTDGVYDPTEKTVYLIADNIPSAERALWVALHETVGHAGLRSLGKDVRQTVAYASKNKFVADLGKAIAKDRQQDYDAIHHNEEAIAELSAALLSDNVDAILERYGVAVPKDARRNLDSIIQRVVEAIRRFVSNMMGKVTDQQIRELVMAAKVAVEGGRIESGKAANDYIKESLRLIRGGYKIVGDFIIPETPEYADNFTGDLAHVPDNDSIPVGPLRVEVGKVISEHRGWGMSHLADNAIRDSSRMPRKETGDLAEDLMRDAIVTMNGVNAVHNDGNTYIFVNPSSRKSIVTKFSNGYYSVVSVRPYNNDPVRLWGNSEWRGRLTFPRPGDSASPLSAASHQDNDSPSLDRNGLDSTSRDKFTIPESTEKGQDKKQPTVTTKKRRNIEEPKLSSSPSLSKMLEDYKSIYNEMMSDEFINNNDFDKWVELRERADSIRMEISGQLESGRANGIGIDGNSLLSRNTTDPKNPWRITYLTKDGEPNGHSEYKSAKSAVDDFLTLSRTKKEMVLFSRAQTLSNAGVNITTTQAGKASTTLPEETKFQAFRRKTQDAMLRFKLVQEWLNEQGVNLTEEANVYQRENISKGKTANLIENFRNKELEPLIKDIAEAKFELGDIATYLEARHIPEANARMRQIHNDPNATANGITDQQAQKVLADFQAMPNFKEFEKLADRVWDIGQETLDMRLNAGLISQEQYDAYKNTYKNWVPLRGNVNPQGFGKGLSTSHKDKRRMGHGFREDEFVLENLVQDRERAIMQVEKNKVSLSVLEFLMQANNPEIGTVGKPQKRATIKDHSYAVEYKGQVVGSFENKGAADSAVLKILNGSSNLQLPGVASILPQDLKVVKTYDPRVVMMARPQLEDNEISVMINGSSVRMQLNDPLLARAGTAAGIEQVGSIIHAAREFNRFLSKAYTAFNPEFVVTNVMRDLYSGTIVLTGKRGAKFVTQVMQNYFPSIRDLWKARNDPSLSPWVERYRKAGGNVGASWLPDIERIGEDAMKALQEYAGARETYRMVYSEQIANGASKTKAKTIAIAKAGTAKLRAIPVFGKLFRVIERVNAVAENSLRLAAFRTAIENGESDQQAAFLSKETINFNRHGEINNTMSALWLFYNPAAQSIQLTGEALFSSKHKAQVWSLVGALTTLSFLLAEIGRGDDDDDEREYQNIPDYVKDRNLVFKFGDIQFTLAVAYGWGWFHTAGRLLSDYMHGEDGEKIAVKLAASFVENFSPMGNPVDEGDNETQFVPFQLLPTVAKIAVGPSVNLNSMGREIHPRKFSDSQPDSQLASRSVRGTIYQDLADFLNDATGGSKYEPGRISVSPDTIKFMVTSITGGAGKFVSDAVTGTMGVANGMAPTLKDTPIVRRFARESGVEDSRAAFWKTVKEVKSASERYNRALRDGDIFYAQNAIDTKQRIIALAEYANKYSAAAAMERDAILDIQKSEDMTKKEKSLRIKEIEIAERRLYDDFLRMFDVAKKIDE